MQSLQTYVVRLNRYSQWLAWLSGAIRIGLLAFIGLVGMIQFKVQESLSPLLPGFVEALISYVVPAVCGLVILFFILYLGVLMRTYHQARWAAEVLEIEGLKYGPAQGVILHFIPIVNLFLVPEIWNELFKAFKTYPVTARSRWQQETDSDLVWRWWLFMFIVPVLSRVIVRLLSPLFSNLLGLNSKRALMVVLPVSYFLAVGYGTGMVKSLIGILEGAVVQWEQLSEKKGGKVIPFVLRDKNPDSE